MTEMTGLTAQLNGILQRQKTVGERISLHAVLESGEGTH